MSDKKPVFGTEEGRKRLEEELHFCRGERQAQIADEMGKAIEQGDLRENAAYDEARRAMWDNNSRIAELEDILNRFQIVHTMGNDGSVGFGSKVTLRNQAEVESVYTIVGGQESDVFAGKISNDSPLGTVLMGKRVGDLVEVKTAKGMVNYTVLNIEI